MQGGTNDTVGRAAYVQRLIDAGYPIFSISEEVYSDLAKKEEGNLYQIVLASTYQIGRIKSYLRRFVEKMISSIWKHIVSGSIEFMKNGRFQGKSYLPEE